MHHFSLLRRFAMTMAFVAAQPCFAGDVYVISHEPVSMSADEIKEVFLGEEQFSGSLRLQPINNAAAQTDFFGSVLKMTAAKYSASWTKKAFRDGLNAPPMKGADADVLLFVRGTPGAIGYINVVPTGVHVVGRF